MYFPIILQMKKQLGQLDKWLEKAESHAAAKKLDPNAFLAQRLIVDQFPLSRQIQITCDTLRTGIGRLTDRPIDAVPDDETTLAALRARVKATIAFVDGFGEKDFAAAATRSITQPRWEGRTMTGHDYFLEHMTPNFFFHLTTTYAVLRKNGVELGKRDYLGTLTQHPPKS